VELKGAVYLEIEMLTPLRRVYYGWWVVAISFAANAVACGVNFLGFAVFFLPITRDLQISRAAASLPFSVSRGVSVFSSPVVGMASDRLGPARIMFAGALLAGLGFVLLSLSDSYVMFLLVYVFMVSLGSQVSSEVPGAVAVSRWFRRRRGIALAMASTGFAAGGAAIVPLLAVAVRGFGWRDTAFAVGILVWAVVPVMTIFLRGSPREEDRGADDSGSDSTPPRTTRDGDTAMSASSELPDFTYGMALKSATYWSLAISYGFRGMVWSAISMHLVAIMVWKSLGESTAGLLLGAYPIMWIPATLATGWLADRWPKHRIAAIGAMSGALGLALLVALDRAAAWQMLVVFALLAPNEGSWSLAWAMVADQFGRRNFGLIMGGLLSTLSFLAIGAPIYSGWVFDQTQSYFWVVLPCSGVLACAGLINWTMPQAVQRRSIARP
jgi:MFS family permease